MAATVDVEGIGPVDVAVILFEGNEFNGEVAPALVELQESGHVRIIDLALVVKDADGNTAVLELEDSELAEAYATVNADPLDLLSEEDLLGIADSLDDDSSALAIVWENTWAAGFARAVRESHGQVIIQDRIPRDVVVAALTALDED